MRTITASITSYVSGKAFGFAGADPLKLVTAVTKGATTYAASVWTEGTATITRAVYVGITNSTSRAYSGGGLGTNRLMVM